MVERQETRKLKQLAVLPHFLTSGCNTFGGIFQCYVLQNIAEEQVTVSSLFISVIASVRRIP